MDWQRTIDKNIGLDITLFHSRFNLTIDYYYKKTDPLMASINLPLSVGTTSRLANVGMQVDKGVNGSLRYALLYNRKNALIGQLALISAGGRDFMTR
ncbi:MAG: hypothetical protein V8R91_12415 [Butyricimonas faecihominis]